MSATSYIDFSRHSFGISKMSIIIFANFVVIQEFMMHIC